MTQPENPPSQSATNGTYPQVFTLSATYSSPTNAPFANTQTLAPFANTQTLAAPSTSLASKTAYLSALRTATISLQETVNKELTARMEEDKVREGERNGSGGGKTVDDKKEEDNYGEEVVEED